MLTSVDIVSLAQEHGGARTATYDQGVGLRLNWRQLIPESQGGVCGGLAMTWLSARKHHLTPAVFKDSKYSNALYKWAEHAQQRGADASSGSTGIDAVAAAFALAPAAAKVLVNNGNVSKWISRSPGPFVFIALSGHAVAAHVSLPKVTFFDPNYGNFAFPSTLKFALFFGDYLRHNEATANYLKIYR